MKLTRVFADVFNMEQIQQNRINKEIHTLEYLNWAIIDVHLYPYSNIGEMLVVIVANKERVDAFSVKDTNNQVNFISNDINSYIKKFGCMFMDKGTTALVNKILH